MSVRRVGAALLAVMMTAAAGCATGDPGDAPASSSSAPAARQSSGSATPSTPSGSASGFARDRPLAGKVVVLDPGHQLGNRNFASEIAAPVDAGGFDKPCNTTGTATDGGFPEATFTWRVAVQARRMLRALGARVILTRDRNSDEAWGPCVDERGAVGNPSGDGPTADVRISIHADGVRSSGARGFHVIRPGLLDGWTDDIVRPSRTLAVVVRDALVQEGFDASTYTGKDGIDVRTDLGTLNHSDVPTVMLELGNMRNDDDASVMDSAAGQRRCARAITDGVRSYLAP